MTKRLDTTTITDDAEPGVTLAALQSATDWLPLELAQRRRSTPDGLRLIRAATTLMLVLVMSVPSAAARYAATAKVRYETQGGYSRWYTVNVTWLTGHELNSATSSFRYSGLAKYAVVFLG